MFRRRAQRILRRISNPDVPAILQQAHQMMTVGDYPNAAITYHKLAQGAEQRFPQRAPFLFIEAGRAAILSGQSKAGIADLRRGLTLLATQRRYYRMQMLGRRIINELLQNNLRIEAEEITNLLDGNLPDNKSVEMDVPAKRPTLPTHCPSCGASIKSDEIEWLDEITAECAYCGSPLRENS